MTFAQPHSLWWFLLVLPLLVSVVKGERRRAAGWTALGREGKPRRDGAIGWLAAVVCLVVALTQPRWGREEKVDAGLGHDVVLLVDVSRSMGARDAVPDRLGLAVESAASLVRALGQEAGSRAAVIAFAGQGRERCPLTTNLGAAVDVLRSLRPGQVQPGGTDLGAALTAGAEAFDDVLPAEGRTIVLFSDGEDHAESWKAAAARLHADGIIVHAVALGDADQGQAVPSGQGAKPLLYHGEPVVSKRNDAPLEAIAKETGGAFLRLGLASADLGSLYLTKIAPIARRQHVARQPPERIERYSWFVVAALTLGLGGTWPRARFASARWAIAVTALLVSAGAVPNGSTAEQAIMEGKAAYAAAQWSEALAAFERASALDPTDAVAAYDAAATLFRLERYADAYARYGQARKSADPALRTKIDFALGNTALALGEVAEAVRHYDACLASTARGATLDAVRGDAQLNLRYARSLPRQPDPQPDDDEKPTPNSRRKGENKDGEGQRTPSPDGEGAQPPGESRDGGPSGPRTGGAGGTGSPRGGTPQERLDAALGNIRAETERRRLPDEPTPGPEGDRKDW